MTDKCNHDPMTHVPDLTRNMIDLREYIEALFREKERALDMAAAERDRAAEVLREEQRRALSVAEIEREKAAAALRAGTDRAIADNYARLSEQLVAMRAIGDEQERHRGELDIERGKAVTAAFDAAEKAVEKAEVAQQRVNITQNEFRGSLSDQAAQLMPRKEFQVLHDAHDERISNIEKANASTLGEKAQRTEYSNNIRPWMIAVAVAAISIVNGIALLILGNVLK